MIVKDLAGDSVPFVAVRMAIGASHVGSYIPARTSKEPSCSSLDKLFSMGGRESLFRRVWKTDFFLPELLGAVSILSCSDPLAFMCSSSARTLYVLLVGDKLGLRASGRHQMLKVLSNL